MTNIYEAFQTDAEMEQEGIEYDMGELGVFKLARAGGANMKFAKLVEKKTRPYRQQIDRGTIDPDLGNRLLAEAFAESVILGWTGVKGRDNKQIKYSPAAAVKLMLDLPELFNELREAATSMANFRNEQIEEDTGN